MQPFNGVASVNGIQTVTIVGVRSSRSAMRRGN